jgi:hypothetical protein
METPSRPNLTEKVLTWIAAAALIGGIAYTIAATVGVG